MPPLSLMIKPVSSLCTMQCAYCFYRDVSARRTAQSLGMMSPETLETLVRRAFAYADGAVHFAFQGGEPTLAGLSFYQRLVGLQRRYNTRGLQVTNAIQTNGLAVDEDFAAFLGQHHFLVGVSLDGAPGTHDALRPDAEGRGTHARVLAAIARLRKHGNQVNILCVVSEPIAQRATETFDALAPFGYIQYIPCLDGFEGEADAYSLTPASYAKFLCNTFDRYERAYRQGHPVSVRDFDNYLQMLAGYPPEHCGMGGVCSRYFLVEADGGVYPCDFYVLDGWRLGDIHAQSFARLARSPLGDAFIEASKSNDPRCQACRWLSLCRGGCRREREPFVDGKPSRRRLCAAYETFFTYAHDRMVAMSRELLR